MNVSDTIEHLKNATGKCTWCGEVSRLSVSEIETICMIGVRENLWFTCHNLRCGVTSFNPNIERFYLLRKGFKETLYQVVHTEEIERPNEFDGGPY